MKRRSAGSDDRSDGSSPPGGDGDRPEKRSYVDKGKGRAKTPPRLPTPPPEMSDGQGAGRSTYNVVREDLAAMTSSEGSLAVKAEQEAKMAKDLLESIEFHTEQTNLINQEISKINERQEAIQAVSNAPVGVTRDGANEGLHPASEGVSTPDEAVEGYVTASEGADTPTEEYVSASEGPATPADD